MATQRHSHFKRLLFIPLIIVLALSACSSPDNSGESPQESNANGQENAPNNLQTGVYTDQGSQVPQSIGFVFDPSGNPISNAALHSGDSSDLNGLLISYDNSYSEEWAVVKKTGFLTGFARAKNAYADAYVFEARLTPLSAVMQFVTDEEHPFGLGDLRDPELEIIFPAGAFSSLPVIAGAAEIDPLTIGPLFEPLDKGGKLYLQRAFGLQAANGEGEDIQLSPGISLGITLRDQGELTEPISLASFDPDQGVWQTLPGSCSREDQTHILCEVNQISPLIGLFTEQDYLWMPDVEDLQARDSGQSGLMSPPLSFSAGVFQQTGGCDGPVGEALDQELLSYIVIISDMLAGGADLNSTTMNDLMKDYSAAALQYADLCKNEKGKSALLKVLKAELLLGLEFEGDLGWDSTQVTDKISDLTIERAKEELAEGKCLDMKEALGAYKEAQMFGEGNTKLPGGEETIEEAFDRKIGEMSSECDLWTGTITILHYPAESHFGLEDWTALRSSSSWSEIHDIRIATHPDTHAVTGRSSVTLNFPGIIYAKVDSDDPCDVNSFQSYYGIPSDEMEVSGEEWDSEGPIDSGGQSDVDLQALFEAYKENPQSLSPEDMIKLGELLSDLSDPDAFEEILSGETESADTGPLEYGLDISFSGTYDGSAFNISDLEYNCYAEIIQYIYNEGEEDDKCEVQFEASIPVHNYSSYLAHGFYGSPPITLQEMLEAGVGTAGGMEIIQGSEEFENPSTDIGSYPFGTSQVTWHFNHVQNQGIQ